MHRSLQHFLAKNLPLRRVFAASGYCRARAFLPAASSESSSATAFSSDLVAPRLLRTGMSALRARLSLILWGLLAAVPAVAGSYVPSSIIPPNPQREFRGVWVATVANIDWP